MTRILLSPPPHKLICLLLLAALAAPAAAQTTVTSSGREGPTACLEGQSEINAENLSIMALSTASVTLTTSSITWNEYVGRLGDTPAPAEANVNVAVYSGRTNSLVRQGGSVFSSTVPYAGESGTLPVLAPKTSYYLEVAVTAIGIPRQVFARRCFMTGGTYTMTVDPSGAQGRNSGCFTISPLTIQDVRNCWCGRKTTLPLFSSAQDNTDWHNMWGCR